MTAEAQPAGTLVSIVTWRAKPGEMDALLGIVGRFLPLARQEPGLISIRVQRAIDQPDMLLFYETYRDDRGLEDHLQTDHIKTLILQEALPKLASRERVNYRTI